MLLGDIDADAIKIGMIGSAALIPALRRLLEAFDGPIVLDPVLAAGGGFDLDGAGLGESMLAGLVPLTSLLTPNQAEARRLAGCEQAGQAAQQLLQSGAAAVLMTGADEAEGDEVCNQLFTAQGPCRSFRWPRLPHSYHGSGCTLASACATRLAFGDDLVTAVGAAQDFTWQALKQADRPGSGQWLPRRRA